MIPRRLRRLRRRFLVEVETVDVIPGSTLEVLVQVAGLLEKMKREDRIVDYGVGLERDATWFVKTAAKAVEVLEEDQK